MCESLTALYSSNFHYIFRFWIVTCCLNFAFSSRYFHYKWVQKNPPECRKWCIWHWQFPSIVPSPPCWNQMYYVLNAILATRLNIHYQIRSEQIAYIYLKGLKNTHTLKPVSTTKHHWKNVRLRICTNGGGTCD